MSVITLLGQHGRTRMVDFGIRNITSGQSGSWDLR